MDPAGPDLNAIKAALEDASGRRVSDLQIGRSNQRLYSTVWNLIVRYGAEDVHYVLKHAGERAGRQVQLTREAAELSSGCGCVVIPEAIHVEAQDQLLVRRFDGKPLSELCRLRNPFRWFGDLAGALRRAGQWLAHYHNATRQDGPEGQPLREYVESRADGLAHLRPAIRDRLLACCRAGLRGDSAVSHGDFTPWNVLVTRDRICVIDFGIGEWICMSPFWDVVSMAVGLQRQMLFTWRSPGRWIPRATKRLVQTFHEAYGLDDRDHPDLELCTAVRHFSFLCGHVEASDTTSRRATWHASELEKALFA